MVYNEAYEAKVEMEKALFKKWDKALNGITDQHKALTTAVLLENYLTHLHDDVRLIAWITGYAYTSFTYLHNAMV